MNEPIDVSDAAAPRSDQQNYEDYIAGPKTVTVAEVRKVGGEQPIEVHLVEFPGRPFKPSKTALRVIMRGWGPDARAWAGRRLTLFGDPSVKWGGQPVGGIRVSHMSHIDKPFKVALTETRGKKATHSVEVLPDAAPARDWAGEVAACTTEAELRALWSEVPADVQPLILARRAELQPEPTPEADQ